MHRLLLVLACLAVLASACTARQPASYMVDAPGSPELLAQEQTRAAHAFLGGLPESRPSLHFTVPLPRDSQGATLDQALAPHMRAMASFLDEHPQARVLIQGHTWNMGQAAENLALSQIRAQDARDFLARRFSLPEEQLLAQGFGGAKPLCRELDLEVMRANQRLEVTLLDPTGTGTEVANPPPAAVSEPESLPAPQSEPLSLDLRFGTGQSSLSGEQYARFLAIGQYLAAHPLATASIEGHTDDVGSAENNLRLSQERAAGVRQDLVEQFGIDGARITSQGFGEGAPIADNATEAGRQANRRVTVVLHPGDGDEAVSLLDVLGREPEPLDPDAEYVVEISISQCRLWLYTVDNGERSLARTFSVATPRPDMPSPLGWGEVERIDFNPSWTPTANMKQRARAHGQTLPDYVPPGSPANPMGTFKLHLSHGQGFRIHGTNAPSSIGTRASSGCIRMNNEEGEQMAMVLHVGTPVHIMQ